LVQSNRLRAGTAAAGSPDMRAADLRLHLERLIDELDDSSLRATLKLMLCEARGAVRKQQGLIALERLEGRDTAGRIARLRELQSVQDALMVAYTGQIPSEDDFTEDQNEPLAQPPLRPDTPVRNAAIGTATRPRPSAFRRLVVTTRQEREADVGSISAAALQAEPARPEPSPVRTRQGRHAARPAG
jgi:hypothetical protein